MIERKWSPRLILLTLLLAYLLPPPLVPMTLMYVWRHTQEHSRAYSTHGCDSNSESDNTATVTVTI